MNAQITSFRPDAGPHHRNLHLVGPAKPGHVYAIPLPTTPLLTGALPYVDWSDAYAVLTPRGAPRRDPQEWAGAIFHSPPLWVRALFGVREVAVRLVGIERGGSHVFATVTGEARRGPRRHRPRTPWLSRLRACRARPCGIEHRRPGAQPTRALVLRARPQDPPLGGARHAGASFPQDGRHVMTWAS